MNREFMKKLEHIGIAVKDIAQAKKNYELILDTTCYKEEIVESEAVITAFFQKGDQKIELLQGTSPASTISKFIEKRGEGIHHIAFEVEDIESEMNRLKEEGYTILIEPKKGADNKIITFLHPKETNGTLIELCQTIEEN